MENNRIEKKSNARFIVLGAIVVILLVIITVCIIKISQGGKTAADVDVISVLELAFEDEIRLYGKKVKGVQTYYPRESGGEPFMVISEYNQDGKITRMIVKSDDEKLNKIVDVEYETIDNKRIVTWVNNDEVIKEIEYIGLSKTKETTYDENGQIIKLFEYEDNMTHNGKEADYIYDKIENIEYIYVHEKYENKELNKKQKLDSVYYRKFSTYQWEYLGEKICDMHGHMIIQNYNYGEMYEAYTYDYNYDEAGSEIGYKRYKDKEVISITEIEYF